MRASPTRRRPGRRPTLPTCHFCGLGLIHDVVKITVTVDGRAVRTCRVCLDGLLFAADLQDADAESVLEGMWHAPRHRRDRR